MPQNQLFVSWRSKARVDIRLRAGFTSISGVRNCRVGGLFHGYNPTVAFQNDHIPPIGGKTRGPNARLEYIVSGIPNFVKPSFGLAIGPESRCRALPESILVAPSELFPPVPPSPRRIASLRHEARRKLHLNCTQPHTCTRLHTVAYPLLSA